MVTHHVDLEIFQRITKNLDLMALQDKSGDDQSHGNASNSYFSLNQSDGLTLPSIDPRSIIQSLMRLDDLMMMI